jgi:hypothetical protein
MRLKPRPFLWISIFVFVALSPLLVSFKTISERSSFSDSPNPPLANQLPWLTAPHINPLREHNTNRVIDPVLVYSTFLGGSNSVGPGGGGQGASILFVDLAGNTYVGGTTNAPDFPVTSGVIQSSNPQNNFVGFLSKFDPNGKTLLFSTYVPGITSVAGLAFDSQGDIFVAGPNGGLTLPIPSGTTPFQPVMKGSFNIGLLKLNSTATSILDATYLGGSGYNFLGGIAVDPQGNLYVAGSTTSNDFPIFKALQSTLGSAENAFIAELNPALGSAVYSTYLGQNSNSAVTSGPHGIAVDASGDAYLVGSASAGFPTTTGSLQPTCTLTPTSNCAFLAKVSAGGSSLLYATYLGNNTQGTAVGLDSLGNVYLTGSADPTFPQKNPLITCDVAHSFISEFDPTGALKFSTCLGQSATSDLALDGFGNVYVTGSTSVYSSGTNVPLKNPIQANGSNVVSLPFVTVVDPKTPSFLFSSYLSGDQGGESDITSGIGVDSNGNIYVVGSSGDFNHLFPVFNAFQSLPGAFLPCLHCGSSDAFILKIAATDGAAAAFSPAEIIFGPQQLSTPSSPEAVTIFDMGSSPLTVSNATVTGDFAIQNNCTTVSPAGGTCTIAVTFTPAAVGTRSGTLTITDSSAGSPRSVQLTGTGATPTLTAAPTTLAFATQPVSSTSAAQTVTLTNTGVLPVQIGNIGVSGDFAETNDCGGTLSSGTCQVNVTFTPTANGNRTGTLIIVDNAPDSPQAVALSGTGGNPTLGLTIAAGSPSSATISAGAGATYMLSIGGNGMNGTASLTCTGAPAAATCTVPSTTSVSATTASTFNAVVTTTSRTQAALHPSAFWGATWAWGFALIGCVFLATAPSRRSRIGYLGLLALFAPAFSSCGGQSGGTTVGTPPGTYTLVVTATSGSNTQTQNLTLVVQ